MANRPPEVDLNKIALMTRCICRNCFVRGILLADDLPVGANSLSFQGLVTTIRKVALLHRRQSYQQTVPQGANRSNQVPGR